MAVVDNNKLPRTSLEEKLMIIDYFKNSNKPQSETVEHFKKQFSISTSSFSEWLRNEDELRSRFKEAMKNTEEVGNLIKNSKRKPTFKYKPINDKMHEIVNQRLSMNLPVTEPILREYWSKFAKQYGISDPKRMESFSHGWLANFKKRHGLMKLHKSTDRKTEIYVPNLIDDEVGAISNNDKPKFLSTMAHRNKRRRLSTSSGFDLINPSYNYHDSNLPLVQLIDSNMISTVPQQDKHQRLLSEGKSNNLNSGVITNGGNNSNHNGHDDNDNNDINNNENRTNANNNNNNDNNNNNTNNTTNTRTYNNSYNIANFSNQNYHQQQASPMNFSSNLANNSRHLTDVDYSIILSEYQKPMSETTSQFDLQQLLQNTNTNNNSSNNTSNNTTFVSNNSKSSIPQKLALRNNTGMPPLQNLLSPDQSLLISNSIVPSSTLNSQNPLPSQSGTPARNVNQNQKDKKDVSNNNSVSHMLRHKQTYMHNENQNLFNVGNSTHNQNSNQTTNANFGILSNLNTLTRKGSNIPQNLKPGNQSNAIQLQPISLTDEKTSNKRLRNELEFDQKDGIPLASLLDLNEGMSVSNSEKTRNGQLPNLMLPKISTLNHRDDEHLVTEDLVPDGIDIDDSLIESTRLDIEMSIKQMEKLLFVYSDNFFKKFKDTAHFKKSKRIFDEFKNKFIIDKIGFENSSSNKLDDMFINNPHMGRKENSSNKQNDSNSNAANIITSSNNNNTNSNTNSNTNGNTNRTVSTDGIFSRRRI